MPDTYMHRSSFKNNVMCFI